MTIAAIYIDESTFTIVDDHAEDLPIGLPVKLIMGTDGHLITYTAGATYSSGTGLTTITVESEAITINLEEMRPAWNYVDDANEESNLAKHYHTAWWDGGEAAFSALSDVDVVTNLVYAGTTTVDVAQRMIGVNEAGDSLVRYLVLGTTNQVIVEIEDGGITFSLPQSIDETASPILAGATFTGLTGVLFGNGATAVSASAPATGASLLLSNATNDAYEWKAHTMANVSDVAFANLTHGDVMTYKSNIGKWVNSSYDSEPGTAGVSIGMVLALVAAMAE